MWNGHVKRSACQVLSENVGRSNRKCSVGGWSSSTSTQIFDKVDRKWSILEFRKTLRHPATYQREEVARRTLARASCFTDVYIPVCNTRMIWQFYWKLVNYSVSTYQYVETFCGCKIDIEFFSKCWLIRIEVFHWSMFIVIDNAICVLRRGRSEVVNFGTLENVATPRKSSFD